jgi:NADH-quinone oxidoreductase subunit J
VSWILVKRLLWPAAGALLVLLGVVLFSDLAWAADHTLQVKGVVKRADGTLWAFRILAALTVVGAALTITRRNAVVAALCLVATLIGTAGMYVVLHASFLAAMQVLVYAGAIMVLFIFVVMSVGKPRHEDIGFSHGFGTKVVGIVFVGVMLLVLIPMLQMLIKTMRLQPGVVVDSFGDVNQISRLLFTDYLFPFEAVSLLLLIAIVGAVMVSRKRSTPQDEDGGQSR